MMRDTKIVFFLVLALVLAACGGGQPTGEDDATEAPAGETPAADAAEGATITIMAEWGGDEEAGFTEVLNAFEEETGVAYSYEGTRNIFSLLRSRVAAGNPPDIAMLPRPGLIAQLAREDVIVPLIESDLLTEETLQQNYGQTWIDLGTVEGAFYGLPVKANSKSTVWYIPSSFEELGVEPPQTWDEMLAISEQYLENDQTPWSIGGADAWTLTDWFENIYVRTAGPEQYRALFVEHDVEWTDESVRNAMERFEQIVSPPEKLAGGAEGTLSTGFIEAFNSFLQEDQPGQMYYEGGFMTSFARQNFPDMACGEDYAFFKFPPISEEQGAPVVVGGDFAIAFNDSPRVREFLQFMVTEEANTTWATAERGAVVSPNSQVALDAYDQCKADEARQLTESETVVFDGSDQAPSEFGSDALFVGLQDFVAEPDTMDEILQQLEEEADNIY